MPSSSTGAPPPKRAPGGSFDDELLKLRQRLTGASGVRPPPPAPAEAQPAASTDAGSRSTVTAPTERAFRRSSTAPDETTSSSRVVQWMDGTSPGQAATNDGGQAAASPAAGRSLAVLSLLNATGESSSPTAGAGDERKTATYLQRAVDDFASAAATIDDFEYREEEEVERTLHENLAKGRADPRQLPRFIANPFDFRDRHVGEGGAAGAVSGLHRRAGPAATADDTAEQQALVTSDAGAGASAPPSSTAAASTVSAAAVMERERQRAAAQRTQLDARLAAGAHSDLYALPEDIARRRNVDTRIDVGPRAKQPPRAGSRSRQAKSGLGPAPPSAPSPGRPTPTRQLATTKPELQVDYSTVKQVTYRDPAVMEPVYDGRIAFCSDCHRVIIGSGKGRCPHCGHINDTTAAAVDGHGHAGAATEADGIATGPTGAVELQPSSLGPNATVQEIEAEERRQFQSAVEAWRSGRGVTESAAPAPAATSEAANAFERSAAAIGRDVEARSGAGCLGSALYFHVLWRRAFGDRE